MTPVARSRRKWLFSQANHQASFVSKILSIYTLCTCFFFFKRNCLANSLMQNFSTLQFSKLGLVVKFDCPSKTLIRAFPCTRPNAPREPQHLTNLLRVNSVPLFDSMFSSWIVQCISYLFYLLVCTSPRVRSLVPCSKIFFDFTLFPSWCLHNNHNNTT